MLQLSNLIYSISKTISSIIKNLSHGFHFDISVDSSFSLDPCFLFNFFNARAAAGFSASLLTGGLYHVGYQMSASVPISASHAAPLWSSFRTSCFISCCPFYTALIYAPINRPWASSSLTNRWSSFLKSIRLSIIKSVVALFLSVIPKLIDSKSDLN